MLECLIIGDSIASGIASVRRDCVQLTEIGLNSQQWYTKYSNRPLLDMESYRYVVISLGSNDVGADCEAYMKKVRAKIHSSNVIWVLPSDEVKAEQFKIVEKIAAQMGDSTLSIKDKVGKDKIHPPTVHAYEEIGRALK
jgi:hypothetical protein